MFSSQCGPANTFSREATRRRSCRTASINRWRSIYSPGWLRLSSIAGTHLKHRSLRTFSLHFRPSSAWSMANSASNTASARVSPIPVRVLVASRKTIHFQPYGFVVSTTSNWIVLYSMTLIPTSCTKYFSLSKRVSDRCRDTSRKETCDRSKRPIRSGASGDQAVQRLCKVCHPALTNSPI